MNLLLLPDLGLINILSYLSCEDVLYAFHAFFDKIENLIDERRGFEQIRLPLNFPHQQFTVIKNLWRYELIKSIVVDNISPYVHILFNSQFLFHSLTNFRLMHLQRTDCVKDFLDTHANTITHLTIVPDIDSYSSADFTTFCFALICFNRLIVFDTGSCSRVQVYWQLFPQSLPSIEHLNTFIYHIGYLYNFADDCFMCHLRSLRVRLDKSITVGIMRFHNYLSLPALERFYLNLHRPNTITWEIIESFTSDKIMPKLSRCALDCCLETDTDIQRVFNSSLFNNDHRHVLSQFVFIKTIKTNDNLLLTNELSAEHTTRFDILFTQEFNTVDDGGFQMWFSRLWPSFLHRDLINIKN